MSEMRHTLLYTSFSDALSYELGGGDNKVIINDLQCNCANPAGCSRGFSCANK